MLFMLTLFAFERQSLSLSVCVWAFNPLFYLIMANVHCTYLVMFARRTEGIQQARVTKTNSLFDVVLVVDSRRYPLMMECI